MTASGPIRLLGLVSQDFGELANTLSLVNHAPVKAQLLLPPSLQSHNANLGPHKVAGLAGPAEVLRALETFQPELLLLASGYLLGINQLLSLAQLATIVEAAQRRGVRIATTDPFLGQWTDLRPRTLLEGAHDDTRDLRQVAALLADALHLYPAPVASAPGRQGWFNPQSVRDEDGLRTLAAVLAAGPLALEGAFWLLVLSAQDYQQQCQLYGRARFEALLLALAEAAAHQGRRLVGLLPPMACASLQAQTPGTATWQGHCDYDQFQAMVLCAEHAFYWNPLSNSVLARLMHERSAFCFSTGHMAHAMPALYRVACTRYFADAPPPLVDLTALPKGDELAARAQAHRHALAPARQALRALPDAGTVLAGWVRGEPSS